MLNNHCINRNVAVDSVIIIEGSNHYKLVISSSSGLEGHAHYFPLENLRDRSSEEKKGKWIYIWKKKIHQQYDSVRSVCQSYTARQSTYHKYCPRLL